MNRTSKILLVVAIATFTLSHISFFSEIGWGILRPIGAVAFILFFIVNVLSKEMELYNRKQSEPVKTERAANRFELNREQVVETGSRTQMPV